MALKFCNQNGAVINYEETSVIFDCYNPVWEESFQFKLDWDQNLISFKEMFDQFNLNLEELNIDLDKI